MTISQNGIKQSLDNQSNFKKTLKIFETTNSKSPKVTNTNNNQSEELLLEIPIRENNRDPAEEHQRGQ